MDARDLQYIAIHTPFGWALALLIFMGFVWVFRRIS